MDPNVVWGTLLGAGLAYEAYALVSKKHGDTLSERTRAWFHTDTRAGKLAFAIAWLGFAAWYFVHILGG